MSKKDEDIAGQMLGAVGGLAVAFGVMAAIKDALGLESWAATIAIVAGLLVLLGYGAWRARKFIARLRAGASAPAAGSPAAAPAATGASPEEEESAAAGPEAHAQLTDALRTAGAIGREEIIRADEVTITASIDGTHFDFLMPPGKSYEEVEKRLTPLAGVLGVTRLHLTTERSRDTDRRVRLLKLDEPPFTRPFPSPTRDEIAAFRGVAIGHSVTGELVGIPTFDKASMLVAGMTQMGKTTFINGLITCLLIAYGEFDLYLLDGKFCGLTRFEKRAARYESSDSPAVFESMVDELNARSDSRYQQKTEAIRNRKPAPRFKPVIFIVDEAADFFASDETREGREQARRITEKTRSLVSKSLESEISTVLMTQRPSTDAIPVKVRDQFLYRMSLYVASTGTARVALGDTYFETVAPINPALLNPEIKGQGVLFAHGRSTLIRGFNFSDEFIWSVVDEGAETEPEAEAEQPEMAAVEQLSPLETAIQLMESAGADFMSYAELAAAMGIEEDDAAKRSAALSKMLGKDVPKHRSPTARGYRLEDLRAAVRTAA
ncbi:FtsK/SpoIIIE domain-containing protein [Streptomyces hydrogenans]|uniref:FtsK/SpoIIIE domain-containing protein n=1 Tax=Streptomyces hydrogenans TaxID=1873719 RepID=UPI0036905DBF